MNRNDPNFDETRYFPIPEKWEDDPYERGFADKLYEDYEEEYPESYGFEEEYDPEAWEEPAQREPVYQPPLPRRTQPRRDPLQPQVWTPNQRQPEVNPPGAQRRPVQRSQGEQYGSRPAARPAGSRSAPRPSAGRQPEEKPAKPRKKHRFLRFILKFFGVLLLLLVITLVVLHVMAKPPAGSSLGEHKEDSCTILLAGTDESGDRTDTIMLLNVNRATGQVSLMSIPRDTKVNCTYWPQKINGAYGINGKGEEGMDSLMGYVEDCVGFRPDGYILLELDVFVDLVDLFGGVDFNVPMDMYYDDPTQDLHIALNSGFQTLDGEEAMGLVRYRYGYYDADIGRVRVQRDFMLSAIDQWVSLKNLWKAPGALAMLKANATTDLSVGNFTWIAEAVLSCGTENMYMTTVPFYISGDGTYVLISADGDYLNLLNTYFNPYENDVTWDDLNIAY